MLKPETHFLIVDDYSTIRNLVTSQLLDFGFSGNFSEAENVDEAIEIMGETPVDFIISDWNMPGKTGFEFLKWVRAQDKYAKLPFLKDVETGKTKLFKSLSKLNCSMHRLGILKIGIHVDLNLNL